MEDNSEIAYCSIVYKQHIVELHFFAERKSSEPELLVSEAWEWREGRLLAYELILKFLITNHIHYMFPTFALPSSRASASHSVDENLIVR